MGAKGSRFRHQRESECHQPSPHLSVSLRKLRVTFIGLTSLNTTLEVQKDVDHIFPHTVNR